MSVSKRVRLVIAVKAPQCQEPVTLPAVGEVDVRLAELAAGDSLEAKP